MDNETFKSYVDAFTVSFSPERNIAAWEAIGAVPFTKRCMESEIVWQDSVNDPMHVIHQRIEESNTVACNLLNTMGFDGSGLRTRLQLVKKGKLTITKPNSVETMKNVANAKTAGLKFVAMGGGHLGNDDALKAAELINRREQRRVLGKDKESRLTAELIEADALVIL